MNTDKANAAMKKAAKELRDALASAPHDGRTETKTTLLLTGIAIAMAVILEAAE